MPTGPRCADALGDCENQLKPVCRRVDGMLVWQRPGEDHADLLASLLPDPDRLLASGEQLQGRGRGCTTARVTIGRDDYLLKRFEYRSVWYGLRHIFKRSRPLKVFVNQNLALAAGVSVPRPLLCLEERTWRFLRRGYVLDSYIIGSRSLEHCWDDLSSAVQLQVLQSAGESYRALHHAGITHGDSNWRNLLITDAEAGPRLWLIDFDNSRRPLVFSESCRQRDVSHFCRDIYQRQLPDGFTEIFRSAAGLA